MICSPNYLMEEINQGRIIQNLCNREVTSPEGIGFDLRLHELRCLDDNSSGRLLTETRKTPSSSLEKPNSLGVFLLEPRKVYLATTVETFDLPSNLAANFYPRSTLFRSGIIFQSSVLPTGYKGKLTFSLINMHSQTFGIEVGARFAHTTIHEVKGNVREYKGQWNGGRVSQSESEKQV